MFSKLKQSPIDYFTDTVHYSADIFGFEHDMGTVPA